MKPEKEQFEEMCSAFALGALDPEEQAIFDEALSSGDEEFKRIFHESVGVSYFINTGVKRVAPLPLVKSKLLKRIQKGNPSSFSFLLSFERLAIALGFGSPRFSLVVALLMAVVAAEIGIYAYLVNIDLEQSELQVYSVESRLLEQQQRFTALSSNLQVKEEILNVLQSPKIEIVIMNGLESNPEGYGKIIWDPVSKLAILQVSKLPALPADKEYQLWYLSKQKNPVSAGVFTVVEKEEQFFRVSSIPVPDNKKDISAFVVTVEPKGGVPQPTGVMYLMGTPGISN
ncbi:MAG: anti-sigma factor [Bacteroidota bacterium]